MTTRTEIESKVREALATALGKSLPSDGNVSQETEPGWDSMKHVEIMLMLEEAFQITFEPDDFTEMTSLDECVRRIAARLGTPAAS